MASHSSLWNKDNVEGFEQKPLIAAKHIPQETFDAIPSDSSADSSGDHEAHPRDLTTATKVMHPQTRRTEAAPFLKYGLELKRALKTLNGS